jgi:hypothetical protein
MLVRIRVGGTVNLYSKYGNHFGGTFKKTELSNYLTEHSQVYTLEIKVNILSCIYTPFTITKMWNQHWCPFLDKKIKNMWHAYTMKYYSSIKKMKSWFLE